MEVVRFATAPHYTMPGHEDIVARRLQGGEASSARFATVGHSTFPAGSIVPMDSGGIDKIYVVVEGRLTIDDAQGASHILSPGDSILISAGESRAVRNVGDAPAAMIVVTPAS